VYLRSLELVGFKSFADKTKLEFEPGMTAIVGPNGCGKSNISDAIRWVIGEQSAKALRGSKMEDCIFNGTDNRKPQGMAEVSITFADCEKSLGTEFHEMTVTRRVFRSGEGQYFINKTPCRLKDIQRLFMDTGVGTVSYSLMEQGRIDRVLSSHPEDRRTIFEEASGITKFKADKSEALRKLEHTEANLLRLTDVIREVKRQIGSLQRQAGKARTYKTLRDELRRLDIYTTREHLLILDSNIQKVEAKILEFSDTVRSTQAEVEETEKTNSVLREALMQTERDIGASQEAGAQAQSRLDHTRELISTNHQRIEEYKSWSERDADEINEHKKQLDEKRKSVTALAAQLEKVRTEQGHAEEELKAVNDNFSKHQQQIDASRSRIHALREESVELDSMYTRLQNQLLEIESRQRSSVIQRERLSAEKAQLARIATAYEKRQTDMAHTLDTMRQEAVTCEKALHTLVEQKAEKESRIAELRQKTANLQSHAAGKHTQIDMLSDENESGEDFSEASRLLLNGTEPDGIAQGKIIGALASHLDVEPSYRLALEAALRSWLDAVLVADTATALSILRLLESRKSSAARVIALDAAPSDIPAISGPARRLIDHVKCTEAILPAVRCLLGNVLVVDALDQIPRSLPRHVVYVTKNGSVVRGDGSMEFWMRGARPSNPLSRKHALLDAKTSLEDIEKEIGGCAAAIANLTSDIRKLEQTIAAAQSELNTSNRSLAQKEGENQVVSKEATEAGQRLETVSWELENLNSQGKSGDAEKETISRQMHEIREQREKATADIGTQTRELQVLESRHSELQTEVTQRRIDFAGLSQKLEHLTSQHDTLQIRIGELESAIEGRSAGVLSYQASIEKLTEAIRTAEGQLSSLEEAVNSSSAKVDGLRQSRERQAKELAEKEKNLSTKRTGLDQIRAAKNEQEVRHAESRMRRQNQIDRITSEYAITLEQLAAEPPPEWEGGSTPPLEACETKVAELRTKLEAMGPVNLVAIEEYQELEERYAFLTTQEQDLIKAKQQLMDMIRTINRTTSEMFSKTFAQVNENFQIMFGKLFNGGTAKLVLVNEEDVLECGIEIIARPPGKRLQNVSLLSGGERTLTAVALLFAIYMIKPSPFCLLDELDAALDESNIGRFVNVLKDFLSQSQFVVITHNRQTIAAANILYGVTMREKGISSIVSMKFTEYVESGMDRRSANYGGTPSPSTNAATVPDTSEQKVHNEA
jgi:chromosome segregation protein